VLVEVIGEQSMLGFERSHERVSDDQISGAERLLCVKFPSGYRAVAKRYGGSYGDVDFLVNRPSAGCDRCGFGLILSLLPESPDSVYSVMACWREHELSLKLVPIAEDGGGNYLCLDYRKREEPEIAFYYHELPGADGIIYVCQTFDEFLTRLVEPVDSDKG
jgi:hypothetical protein